VVSSDMIVYNEIICCVMQTSIVVKSHVVLLRARQTHNAVVSDLVGQWSSVYDGAEGRAARRRNLNN
jgi:hypothetical protein